jgi:bla regulator protein BlaR1
MTSAFLIYGTVLGLFLAISAHFLDGALRSVGRPTRWLWLGALAGTTLAPLALPFMPQGLGQPGTLGMVIPVEALFQMGMEALPSASRGSPVLGLLDQLLMVGWIAASAILLLLMAGGAWRLYRESSGWPKTRAGNEEVLISEGLGPAVLGILNPRIVLPSWTLSLSPEKLEMIVLHEREHRRARDPALLAVGILMAIVAPWNIPLWWSLRRLRLAVEGDCDSRVLASGIRRERYGALLVDMASTPRALFPLAPALTEGGNTFLERRLQMMKNHVRSRGLRGAVMGCVAGGFFLFLACETPTPPMAEEASSGISQAVAMDDQTDASFGVNHEEAWVITGEESLDRVTAESPVSIRLSGDAEGAADPLIYIDGVLQENGMAAVQALDADQIERIEVIKGAAADAQFGPDAKNGVIQVFLKK